jgi:hypothetical protein
MVEDLFSLLDFQMKHTLFDNTSALFSPVNYTHSATKEVFFDNMAKITLISL